MVQRLNEICSMLSWVEDAMRGVFLDYRGITFMQGDEIVRLVENLFEAMEKFPFRAKRGRCGVARG